MSEHPCDVDRELEALGKALRCMVADGITIREIEVHSGVLAKFVKRVIDGTQGDTISLISYKSLCVTVKDYAANKHLFDEMRFAKTDAHAIIESAVAEGVLRSEIREITGLSFAAIDNLANRRSVLDRTVRAVMEHELEIAEAQMKTARRIYA